MEDHHPRFRWGETHRVKRQFALAVAAGLFQPIRMKDRTLSAPLALVAALCSCALLMPLPSAWAADDTSAAKQEIDANIAAYTKAYAAKDAAALAAFWSETGQFISPVSGNFISGRKQIEAEYAGMFAEEGDLALEVNINSIRFITEDVAVEEGTAKVIYPGELPSQSRYRVIHTRQDGKWLIDSVRETVLPLAQAATAGDVKSGPAAELKDLSWLIGDWVDDGGEGSAVEFSCSWGMGMRFIKREFSVWVEDRVEMDGIEVIGWDPSEKIYRSWVFDSEGGFGSATWTRDGEKWIKHLTGTTSSGKKAFAAHIMIKLDDKSYQWSAHGRELDGKLLPNIDPVTVVRQNAAP